MQAPGCRLEAGFKDPFRAFSAATLAQRLGAASGPAGVRNVEPGFEGATAELGEGDFLGFGWGPDAATSLGVARLEAMERYAGAEPRDARRVVYARRGDIEGDTLDPHATILHAPQDYRDPRNRCVPYREDMACAWVAGRAVRSGASSLTVQPIRLPAQLAYYRHRGAADRPEDRFVYETSNGAAIGAGLGEALLFAGLEALERDAALAYWCADLAPPRIDAGEARDPQLRRLLAQARARGFDVSLHDIRQHYAIPIVQACVRARTAGGFVCRSAAAARPTAQAAALHALREAFGALRLDPELTGPEQARAEQLAVEPARVSSPRDHLLYYSTAAGLSILEPLFSAEPETGFVEEGPLKAASRRALLRTLAAEIVGSYGSLVFVDQTFGELRRLGLRCVKVLAPGALPLTFGQQYRRVSEGRLRRLYAWAGAAARPMRLAPHPLV